MTVNKAIVLVAVLSIILAASCVPYGTSSAGPASYQDRVTTAALSGPEGSAIEYSPGGYIDFHSRRLVNNTWGAPTGETLKSGVYVRANSCFGSDWNRPEPRFQSASSQIQPIYPSVRIGGSPWEGSSCPQFPIKLGDLKSLSSEVAYTYPVKPTGVYDLAYDIFLLDSDKPCARPCLKAEVMIWLHGTATEPIYTYKGDFDDGINKYGLYSWEMPDGRLYYAFLMKGEPQYTANHTVDVRRLLGYLPLDSNWYIHGVELGNEVWHGSGNIEISSFSMSMNGHDL